MESSTFIQICVLLLSAKFSQHRPGWLHDVKKINKKTKENDVIRWIGHLAICIVLLWFENSVHSQNHTSFERLLTDCVTVRLYVKNTRPVPYCFLFGKENHDSEILIAQTIQTEQSLKWDFRLFHFFCDEQTSKRRAMSEHQL